ncbi:hypothetical protein [Chryseobacterium sp. MYb328]|uniref:hypothetical protein n=1 Tax=Chryseobacterium sp. MYb328 TaxID=2745231 RepID=UPI0030B568C4
MKNLLFISLFLSAAVHSQVKKMDIEKFRKHIGLTDKENITSNRTFTYENGGNVITLWQQSSGEYREDVQKKNSVYTTTFLYNQYTYALQYEGLYCKGTPVGIHKKYSKYGKLIEQTDQDLALREIGVFTRKDMAKIMKRDFNINIEKEDELYMMNAFDKDGKYFWRIVCRPHPEKGADFAPAFAYLFDAQTGKFLSKSVFVIEG